MADASGTHTSGGHTLLQHGSHRSTVPQVEPGPQVSASQGTYSLTVTLALALVGMGCGTALSSWQPVDEEIKTATLQWIGLPGDLFIRSLKAIVLPMVFVNASAAIVDMMQVGRVSSVGLTTVGVYMGSTVVAAAVGFASILAFSPMIRPMHELETQPEAEITIGCNEAGFLLTEWGNGSVACTNSTVPTANNTFIINDLNSTFVTADSGRAPDDLTLSDTMYKGIFEKLFTANIFTSFMNSEFAAVIVFALVFGAALSRVMRRSDGHRFRYVLGLLQELDIILMLVLDWIISLTPVAVISLIMKAVGGQEKVSDSFTSVAVLATASILAMLLHMLLIDVGLYGVVRRANPFSYLRMLGSAQMMAFACASSAATIPVTLKAIALTKIIPEPIANFVVPLGATINMDGSAIYYTCTVIWLAGVNGDELNAAACFMLIIISTIGSVGTAPVPSSGLALILTAYNTVFNKTGTPIGFELIVAIDWFMDRCLTTLNVTGDCVVSAVVAHLCPLDGRGDAQVHPLNGVEQVHEATRPDSFVAVSIQQDRSESVVASTQMSSAPTTAQASTARLAGSAQ